MGRDKPALTFDGEPLWSRQLRTLHGLPPESILVSARTRPAWCPAEIETVLDEPPSRGPLSGLAAALKKIRTTHLLALAIDLPQMTSAHLKKLGALARPGIGVVPQTGEFFEPLSAVYPAESRAVAERMLAAKDVSLHNFIRALAARRQICFHLVTQSESAMYRNVNTPED